MNRAQKSSLKIYPIIMSLTGVAVVLIVNFVVLPKLVEGITAISPLQAKEMRIQVRRATLGFFILIFLLYFCLWKIGNKLKEERKKAQEILRINPTDPIAQKKIKEIERKGELYLTIMEPIFIILLGVMVAWMISTILAPIYGLVAP